MRVGILHIGDELLTGNLDPYPREMIAAVRSRRVSVDLLELVGDREDDIVRSLRHAEELGINILIVTGGLGPTLDDLTREAVAAYLGTELTMDEEAVRWLERSLSRMHARPAALNDINKRMARVPRGAVALRNITGAACGIEATKGTMTLFCFPGFPNEMLPMFHEYVMPRIGEGDGHEIEITVWKGESSLEPLFQEVAAAHKVRIASLPSVRWREEGNKVVFKGTRGEAEAARLHFQRLMRERFGDPDAPSCL